MNTARSAATVAVLLSVFLPASARANGGAGIFGSINIPMGDFADDESENFHNATLGFGAGVDLNAKVNATLDWTTSAAVLFNPLDESSAVGGMEVDAGSWVTIPILTGPRLMTPDNGAARGYVQAQGGIALGSQTETAASDAGGTVTANIDWSTAVAFGFGGGILVRNFDLGLRFTHLFEHEHEVTLDTPDGSIEGKGEGTISILQVVLGYNF